MSEINCRIILQIKFFPKEQTMEFMNCIAKNHHRKLYLGVSRTICIVIEIFKRIFQFVKIYRKIFLKLEMLVKNYAIIQSRKKSDSKRSRIKKWIQNYSIESILLNTQSISNIELILIEKQIHNLIKRRIFWHLNT